MAELDLGLVVGPAGHGVPSGGTTGQVLKKKSAADYDTEWEAAGTADALPLAGGTMSGSINMAGNRVTGLGTPSASGDAVPKSYADALLTGYRTAAAQDVIDAAQDADIASRAKADEIGIVITGARPSMVVSAGQYVIVRGSTITGITDGLYKAINALSPSTDVTAADLTAVTGGAANSFLADYFSIQYLRGSWNNSYVSAGAIDCHIIGKIMHINAYFLPTTDIPSNTNIGTIPASVKAVFWNACGSNTTSPQNVYVCRGIINMLNITSETSIARSGDYYSFSCIALLR